MNYSFKLSGLTIMVSLLLSVTACNSNKENKENTAVPVTITGVEFDSLVTNVSASFRGLYAVNDTVVWTAGSNSTVLKTIDGGNNWKLMQIDPNDSLEFRDVHAFDDQKAYVLTAGQPARLYATNDGGENWDLQYENKNPQAFFDGFDFWNDHEGIAMSDPVNGKILFIVTRNGRDWIETDSTSAPVATENEGSFAASGTTVVVGKPGVARIATSGTEGARILITEDYGKTWASVPCPVHSDLQYAGIYSIAFKGDTTIAVGGSFMHPDSTLNNAAISYNGGEKWELLKKGGVGGYRSCVAPIPFTESSWITVSRVGGEFSNDNGRTWTAYDKNDTYYSFSIGENASVGYASGANGKIAKVRFETSVDQLK